MNLYAYGFNIIFKKKKHLSLYVRLNNWFWIFSGLFICLMALFMALYIPFMFRSSMVKLKCSTLPDCGPLLPIPPSNLQEVQQKLIPLPQYSFIVLIIVSGNPRQTWVGWYLELQPSQPIGMSSKEAMHIAQSTFGTRHRSHTWSFCNSDFKTRINTIGTTGSSRTS